MHFPPHNRDKSVQISSSDIKNSSPAGNHSGGAGEHAVEENAIAP
jgi:hypothetical protein